MVAARARFATGCVPEATHAVVPEFMLERPRGRSVALNEGVSRAISARTARSMEDEDIVAIGLLTRTHLTMLGSSLKIVFRVDDDAAQFAELLQALDRVGEGRGTP